MKEIFDAPAHPYTRALLESIPRMSDSRRRLTAIEGQPPDLAALPAGCAFHPRCPEAMDRCREEAPPDITVSPPATSAAAGSPVPARNPRTARAKA